MSSAGAVVIWIVVTAFFVGCAITLGLVVADGIDDSAQVRTTDVFAPVVDEETTTSTSTTAPPTTTTTAAAVRAKSSIVYPTDELLDDLAYCETGGTMDPTTNTGNGYYGAFQFDVETWWSVGGEGYPHEHPYAVQRDLARTLILQAGWGRFPACSRAIGAR